MSETRDERLIQLVRELYRLEQRVILIKAEIAEELGESQGNASLHRLAFEALLDGEKGIGDIVRHILESGYRHTDKNRELASVVTGVLNQLKTIGAITKYDDTREYGANDMTVPQVIRLLKERFRPRDDDEPSAMTQPSPPPQDGPRRRGRPPGSRTRRS